MHFEVPKAKTFKEFGGEYLMIVISILTALALEAAVEKVHHEHLAHEAAGQIDAEMRQNVAAIQRVLAHNTDREKALEATREQMLAAIRDGVGDAVFLERFRREWYKAVTMSLHSPSLRREAWEAAVASQAVTWMPRATLERYASVYAEMRENSAILNGGSMNFLDGPRMQDVFTNVELGLGDPKDIYRTVTQMLNAYGSVDGNLKSLQDELASQAETHSR